MIVYNCEHRWFEKQADANAYRRTLAQPRRWPVTSIRVEGREDLAALLNALYGVPKGRSEVVYDRPSSTVQDRSHFPLYMRDPNWRDTPIPDWVPKFLLKDFDRR